ncbi:MAG: hypothetical protein IPF57_11850 [Gammaproteobacteria bacterium]|nr:hypothetical protein [Gammaproteobacteria bacterium]
MPPRRGELRAERTEGRLGLGRYAGGLGHRVRQLENSPVGFADGAVFLMPFDLPGVSKGKPLEKIGQRALNQGEIFFDNVEVPAQFLLGEGPELYPLIWEMNLKGANIAMGQQFVGVARAAYDLALDYARQWVQGRLSIIEHQNVKTRIFGMFQKLEVARSHVRRVAIADATLPGGVPFQYAASAKVFATQNRLRSRARRDPGSRRQRAHARVPRREVVPRRALLADRGRRERHARPDGRLAPLANPSKPHPHPQRTVAWNSRSHRHPPLLPLPRPRPPGGAGKIQRMRAARASPRTLATTTPHAHWWWTAIRPRRSRSTQPSPVGGFQIQQAPIVILWYVEGTAMDYAADRLIELVDIGALGYGPDRYEELNNTLVPVFRKSADALKGPGMVDMDLGQAVARSHADGHRAGPGLLLPGLGELEEGREGLQLRRAAARRGGSDRGLPGRVEGGRRPASAPTL